MQGLDSPAAAAVPDVVAELRAATAEGQFCAIDSLADRVPGLVVGAGAELVPLAQAAEASTAAHVREVAFAVSQLGGLHHSQRAQQAEACALDCARQLEHRLGPALMSDNAQAVPRLLLQMREEFVLPQVQAVRQAVRSERNAVAALAKMVALPDDEFGRQMAEVAQQVSDFFSLPPTPVAENLRAMAADLHELRATFRGVQFESLAVRTRVLREWFARNGDTFATVAASYLSATNVVLQMDADAPDWAAVDLHLVRGEAWVAALNDDHSQRVLWRPAAHLDTGKWRGTLAWSPLAHGTDNVFAVRTARLLSVLQQEHVASMLPRRAVAARYVLPTAVLRAARRAEGDAPLRPAAAPEAATAGPVVTPCAAVQQILALGEPAASFELQQPFVLALVDLLTTRAAAAAAGELFSAPTIVARALAVALHDATDTGIAEALEAQTPQQDGRTSKTVVAALKRCAPSSWGAADWLGAKGSAQGGGLCVQGADPATLAAAAVAIAKRMRDATFAKEWFTTRSAKAHQRKRLRALEGR